MNHLVNNALKLVKANAPEILTAVGVGGVITTAILTAKATLKAEKIIDNKALKADVTTKKDLVKEVVKSTWKCYIPPVISGAGTIAAIIATQKVGSRRTAAAVTAYSLTEQAFTNYRGKIAEEIGKGKELRVRDDLAQEKVTANPPNKLGEVLVVGRGNVLCFDARSCRYFRSSMEDLKRAENDINFQLNHERYMSLSEFYALIGLAITKESVYNGWNLGRGLMELDITATIADSDEPCLVVDFNYCDPLHDDPSDPFCQAGTE